MAVPNHTAELTGAWGPLPRWSTTAELERVSGKKRPVVAELSSLGGASGFCVGEESFREENGQAKQTDLTWDWSAGRRPQEGEEML